MGLSVLKEVNWKFLFSPKEIFDLMREAAVKKISVGIDLNLTILIREAYTQEIHYENNQLSGQLCFHPFTPSGNCGGLPLNPHLGLLMDPTSRLETAADPTSNDFDDTATFETSMI